MEIHQSSSEIKPPRFRFWPSCSSGKCLTVFEGKIDNRRGRHSWVQVWWIKSPFQLFAFHFHYHKAFCPCRLHYSGNCTAAAIIKKYGCTTLKEKIWNPDQDKREIWLLLTIQVKHISDINKDISFFRGLGSTMVVQILSLHYFCIFPSLHAKDINKCFLSSTF